MWKGPVADPGDSCRSPFGLGRGAGEGNHIEWQLHFTDDPLDLPWVGKPRHEETAGAGIGKGLAAFDHLVDQRIVTFLDLQVEVGPRIDKEIIAHGAADCLDPMALLVE